jgi:hypothetical protein
MRKSRGSLALAGWVFVLLALLPAAVALVLAIHSQKKHLRSTYIYWQEVRKARQQMSHPIIDELADGTTSGGDPVEAVMARHPPSSVVRHDPYTTVCYTEDNREVFLIARDGRLEFARLCGNRVFPCTFFDTLTASGRQQWRKSYEEALDQIARARMAVVGAAASIHNEPPNQAN